MLSWRRPAGLSRRNAVTFPERAAAAFEMHGFRLERPPEIHLARDIVQRVQRFSGSSLAS